MYHGFEAVLLMPIELDAKTYPMGVSKKNSLIHSPSAGIRGPETGIRPWNDCAAKEGNYRQIARNNLSGSDLF
jgi:hypothetical protein